MIFWVGWAHVPDSLIGERIRRNSAESTQKAQRGLLLAILDKRLLFVPSRISLTQTEYVRVLAVVFEGGIFT
jgi:hypothetical protein